jgi:hypothetical protein
MQARFMATFAPSQGDTAKPQRLLRGEEIEQGSGSGLG